MPLSRTFFYFFSYYNTKSLGMHNYKNPKTNIKCSTDGESTAAAYLKLIFSVGKSLFSNKPSVLDSWESLVKRSEGELSTFSKVQTIVRQLSEAQWRKKHRGVAINRKIITGHQRHAIITPKMLIKHSFRGLVDPACVHCIAAFGQAGLKKSDRKCRLRLYFLLGADKTLFSCYKNDVK